MTFEDWWKAGTSTEVPLYGEANAKKAWDHQQTRIEELKAENDDLNAEINTKAEWNMKYFEELAELREAVNVYLNLEDCISLEALEALLPEEGK